MVTVVGVDPGLAACGWAVLQVWVQAAGVTTIAGPVQVQWGARVLGAGVIVTEPSARRQKVLAADDLVRRGLEFAQALDGVLVAHHPGVVCAEAMSWPRSSSACAKVGIAWGVILAWLYRCQVPVLQPSPQAVRRALGVRGAGKGQVASQVLERCPELGQVLGRVLPGLRNHAYDAVAAVLASLNSELMRAVAARA